MAQALAEEYRRSGVHGMVPGDKDLAFGLPWLLETAQRYQLPYVAANLQDAAGRAVFPAYRLLDVASLKVAVIGVVGEEIWPENSGFQLSPAREAVLRTLAQAQEAGARFVVLLAHMRLNTLKTLLSEVKGVHIAVAGHDRRVLKRAQRVGDTLIVCGGDRGRQVGFFDLSLVDFPYVLQDAGEVRSLEEDVGRLKRQQRYYASKLAKAEGQRPGDSGSAAAPSSKAGTELSDSLASAAKVREFQRSNLARVKKALQEALVKVEQAKQRPVKGDRFVFTMQSLDKSLTDHPQAAAIVAKAKADVKALGPSSAPSRPAGGASTPASALPSTLAPEIVPPSTKGP